MSAPAFRDELDSLLRVFAVARKQWPMLAAGVALGTGGGFLHAANQTPVYAATAQVAVGNDPWRTLLPGELAPLSPYSERMTFDTQPLVIQSWPVAERAARNLEMDPGQAARIRAATRVAKIEGTRVFTITAEADDAERSKAIANGVADAYIQVTTENRAKTARESIRWLENQLVDYEAKVERSHQAMIDYIEKENLTRPGAAIVQAQTGMAPLLERLRQQKIEAELELDRLSTRYGEKHPDLRDKKDEVRRIEAKIAAEENSLRSIQKKNIRYDILAGRARADMELYGVLARKLEQANISSSLVEDAISVVQYATAPGGPVRPSRPKIVLLGAVTGFLFAAGAAFLRETFDQRITSVRQLAADFPELPLIGSVPDVTGDEGYGADGRLQLFSPTATAGSEAVRSLRANVKFALVGIEKRVIVVTSCRPGEGKSMITANLGAAMASAGQRVIVVDADLRRPTLHRQTGVRMADAGLSTLIADDPRDPDLEAAIIHLGPGRPDLLPAGPPPPNPGDFLESPALARVLDRLRAAYDIVLVDSPPGDLFADAQLLGAHAGAVLLVVRAGIAERNGLGRLLNQLRRSGHKTLGVVFNGVARTDLSYYEGYGGYGRREPAGGADPAEPTGGREEPARFDSLAPKDGTRG